MYMKESWQKRNYSLKECFNFFFTIKTDILHVGFLFSYGYSAEPRVYLGIPFTRVTVDLDSWPPMVGAERTKIFDFDNPRLLEKALSGKELYRKLLLHTKKY